MSSFSQTRETHAAQATVSGIVSNGATWTELFILVDASGNQLTGVSADEWRFQFRADPQDTAPDLTLTTTDGTLVVTEAAMTTLLIDVPQSSLSALEGEYVADLVSKGATDSRLTHRAHGIVIFRADPIAF